MVCLWICVGSVGIRIVAFFDKCTAIRRTRRIFTAKGDAILYKTAHCSSAIKVRRTRWQKSDAHGAMFSSAMQRVCCILFDAYRNFVSTLCLRRPWMRSIWEWTPSLGERIRERSLLLRKRFVSFNGYVYNQEYKIRIP